MSRCLIKVSHDNGYLWPWYDDVGFQNYIFLYDSYELFGWYGEMKHGYTPRMKVTLEMIAVGKGSLGLEIFHFFEVKDLKRRVKPYIFYTIDCV